ncbi:MAG TPA: HNH endonuclease signature motif containing protein [Candidatus Paceibacterota bacterium]|nr:HNH endonuclease signature motif containing protein [Candidatus Paceibacterota bacterium]
MPSDVSERLRGEVADRAYHVCEYCLVHEDDTFWGCQVDHIVSRKHGGATDPENLAWACACCNNAKGSDVATYAGQPPRLVRLFHPRSDRWGDSFLLSGVRIDPGNMVGEGTAKLLQLNHTNRLRERETLAETGRYPTVEALARMKE